MRSETSLSYLSDKTIILAKTLENYNPGSSSAIHKGTCTVYCVHGAVQLLCRMDCRANPNPTGPMYRARTHTPHTDCLVAENKSHDGLIEISKERKDAGCLGDCHFFYLLRLKITNSQFKSKSDIEP